MEEGDETKRENKVLEGRERERELIRKMRKMRKERKGSQMQKVDDQVIYHWCSL